MRKGRVINTNCVLLMRKRRGLNALWASLDLGQSVLVTYMHRSYGIFQYMTVSGKV